MAILHVREIPDEMYTQLKQLAQHNKRSLSAQVMALLEQSLEQERVLEVQRLTLQRIGRRRTRLKKPPAGQPDTLALLREDRLR